MDFTYVDKINKISDYDIIKDLLHVKDEIIKKDKITIREYLTYGKYGQKAIKNHFGTWNKLLSNANIKPIKVFQHLSKEEIFRLIEELWIQLGRQPNLREFESMTKHTKKIIVSNFGKWSICLQEFVKWKTNKDKDQKPLTNTLIKHNTPREPSKSLRYDVLARDNYKCVICGRSTSDGIRLHVDHITPYSLGGETIIDNLQTLCSDCNLGKSNKKD